MDTADAIEANYAKRRSAAGQVSDLNTEMATLIKRGYAEGRPVPELARLAHVTRGRIYQILKEELT